MVWSGFAYQTKINHDSTWYISIWSTKTEVTQGYQQLLNKLPGLPFFLTEKTHQKVILFSIIPPPNPGTLAETNSSGCDLGRGSHSNSEGFRWQDHGRLCSLALNKNGSPKMKPLFVWIPKNRIFNILYIYIHRFCLSPTLHDIIWFLNMTLWKNFIMILWRMVDVQDHYQYLFDFWCTCDMMNMYEYMHILLMDEILHHLGCITNGIFTISNWLAGFLPSTVSFKLQVFITHPLLNNDHLDSQGPLGFGFCVDSERGEGAGVLDWGEG